MDKQRRPRSPSDISFTVPFELSLGGDDQRTVVSTRPPRSERTVQNSVQPQQHPADAEAQQQAEHQVHLLLGHTVTHKVVL